MQIENLARAGAFDSIETCRSRVHNGAETILRRAQATAEEKNSGQIGLFRGNGGPEPLRLANIPEWEALDRLGYEAEAIGFHLTGHPMDAYTVSLKRLGAVPSNLLEAKAQGGGMRLKLAGVVVNTKERITRSGSRMAWVRLSDAGGSYEVTCFSEVLGRARDVLTAGTAVLVTADVRLEGEALRITASDITSLDAAVQNAAGGVRIWLQQTESVPHIRALLEREGKGKGRVVLIPRIDDGQDVEITLPGGFNLSPRLAQALKILPGIERVEDV
jgi:DNA polymerase-3 subunit alpha